MSRRPRMRVWGCGGTVWTVCSEGSTGQTVGLVKIRHERGEKESQRLEDSWWVFLAAKYRPPGQFTLQF